MKTQVGNVLRIAIDKAEAKLTEARDTAVGARMTLTKEQHPTVQNAKGALDALADLRTELVSRELADFVIEEETE